MHTKLIKDLPDIQKRAIVGFRLYEISLEGTSLTKHLLGKRDEYVEQMRHFKDTQNIWQKPVAAKPALLT
jgi:hypothetical protein